MQSGAEKFKSITGRRKANEANQPLRCVIMLVLSQNTGVAWLLIKKATIETMVTSNRNTSIKSIYQHQQMWCYTGYNHSWRVCYYPKYNESVTTREKQKSFV